MPNFRYDLPRLLEGLEAAGELRAFLGDVFSLRMLRSESPEIDDVLSDPQLSAESKVAYTGRLFEGVFAETFHAFLLQLARNGDIHHFDRIADRFMALVTSRDGMEFAEVRSVIPLTREQMVRIRDHMSALMGKYVFVYNTIARGLLAGFTLRCRGRTLDLSAARDLQALSTELAAETARTG